MGTTTTDWLRRNWFHVLVGSCLILLVIKSDFAVKVYYRVLLRPQLLARGATSCDAYRPVSGAVEDSCDLVRVNRRGDEIVEIFESDDGLVETTVVSVNGHRDTRTRSFRANRFWLVFPATGVVLYAVLVIQRVVRFRGAFLSFKRYPLRREEWILFFYAVLLVVASITVTVFGV